VGGTGVLVGTGKSVAVLAGVEVGVSAMGVGVLVGVTSLTGVGVPVGVAWLVAVGLGVDVTADVWVGVGVSNLTNLTRVTVGFSVDALSGLPQASTGKNSSRPMKMVLKCTDDSFREVRE